MHLEISLPKLAVISCHCKHGLSGRIPRWLERKGNGNLPYASKASPQQESSTDIPLVPLKPIQSPQAQHRQVVQAHLPVHGHCCQRDFHPIRNRKSIYKAPAPCSSSTSSTLSLQSEGRMSQPLQLRGHPSLLPRSRWSWRDKKPAVPKQVLC